MYWAYVIAWVILAESPFVIWGSQSRAHKWFAWSMSLVVLYIQETILGYNVVSALIHPFGHLGINYGFPALGLALFLLGRLACSERPRLLRLVVGLELMSACGIVLYGNLSSPPHSFSEPLAVAFLSAISSSIIALALFGLGKLLRRWLQYDRLPFVLGGLAPAFVIPFNPTTLVAYLIGAVSGWLVPVTHEPYPLTRKKRFLVFLSLIALFTVLIVCVNGTSDVFYFDLSVGMILGYLVQQVTRTRNRIPSESVQAENQPQSLKG